MRFTMAILVVAVAGILLVGPTGCSPEAESSRTSSAPYSEGSTTAVISASWAAEEVFSEDRQAEVADLIVRGTVVLLGSPESGNAEKVFQGEPIVYRDVAVRVDRTLKGDVARGATISVRVLGGSIGGQTLVAEGEPEFSVNEDVLLFLTSHPGGYVPEANGFQYSVVFGMHGKYRIKDGYALRSDRVPEQERAVDLKALEAAAALSR